MPLISAQCYLYAWLQFINFKIIVGGTKAGEDRIPYKICTSRFTSPLSLKQNSEPYFSER